MKIIKWILWLALFLVIVLVGGGLFLATNVDPNSFKPTIESKFKQETGRDLNINGDLSWRFYPWLGVTVNKIVLANHADFTPVTMLEAEQVDIQLKLLPLLSKQIEVGKVNLSAPKVNLAINAQGQSNWADMLTAQNSAANEAAGKEAGLALGGLIIQGVDISDAQLDWDDRLSNQRVLLSQFNLSTGQVKPGKPIDFEINSELQATGLPSKAKLTLSGAVMLNAALDTLSLQGLSASVLMDNISANIQSDNLDFDSQTGQLVVDNINGDFAMDQLSTELALQAIQFSSRNNQALIGKAAYSGQVDLLPFSGESTKLSFDLNQNQLRIAEQAINGKLFDLPIDIAAHDLSLNIAHETFTSPDVKVNLDGQLIKLDVAIEHLFSELNAKGRLKTTGLKAKEVLAKLGINALGDLPENALNNIDLETNFEGGLDSLALNALILKVDDSRIAGDVSIPSFGKAAYRFNLTADSLNVDQYLSQDEKAVAKEAGPAVAVALPFAALKGLDVKGQLKIASLTLTDLSSKDVLIKIDTEKDRIEIAPLRASLYGGVASNDLVYDISGEQPKIQIKAELNSLDVGRFLSAFKVTDKLLGTGDVNSNLKSTGLDADEVIANLNGDINIRLQDGALRGANIQKSMLKVAELYKNLSGKEVSFESEVGDQTNFSDFSSHLSVDKGVMRTTDIDLKAPGLRITGGGKVNLNSSKIDLDIVVAIVGSFEGQGGQAADKLKGEKIPVKITGDLTSPNIRPDFSKILKRQLERKLSEKYLGGKKLSGDAFKKSAKDKFNNKLAESLGLAPSEQAASTEGKPSEKKEAAPQVKQAPQDSKALLKQRLEEEKKQLKEKLLKNLFGG